MKKLNLICASIALLAAGAANAGTAVSTATKIAVENFGGSAANQDTLAVLGAPISYSMSTITAVNSGSTVYFTVRLTGGKFAAAPGATNFTFGGQACIAGAATTANPSCAVTASTDKSTIKVAVTTAASYTLGLGAFTWTPIAADINTVNATLAAVGGKVSAAIGLVTLNPTAIEATDTQATIDAPVATGDLAVGAKAVNGVVAASAYTGKIDLTVSPAASDFTTPNYAVLGSYKFTDLAAGGVKIRSGASDYTLANGSAASANAGASVVVTPGATQSFPVGSVVSLHTNVTCSAAVAATTTATVTAGNAATAKTVTTTTALTTGTEYFVCITKPTATNLATPIQATIAATVIPGSTNDLIASASGLGYNLGYNGSTVDVLTYWPGALDAYAYKGYLRITNTGSVKANVSLAHVSPADGTVGTAKVIIADLMPGQSKLISTVAIDAVVGVAPSNLESGRVKVTAPTDGLRVQSLLQTGADAPIEYRANNGL